MPSFYIAYFICKVYFIFKQPEMTLSFEIIHEQILRVSFEAFDECESLTLRLPIPCDLKMSFCQNLGRSERAL